ncbi:MAG: hypothetical protein LLG00_17230, partial [Planctomycetaceae bacterium]|nr:hypothetical protein [Planctomycetaceae bacterium]
MFRTVVTFAAVFVAVVARADTNWVLSQDQVGDWPLTSNWTNGVPTSSVNAYIVNGGTASIGGAGQACYFLSLGGTSTGTVQMGGGSLSAMSEFVGDQGTGTYTQTGGTNTVSA